MLTEDEFMFLKKLPQWVYVDVYHQHPNIKHCMKIVGQRPKEYQDLVKIEISFAGLWAVWSWNKQVYDK